MNKWTVRQCRCGCGYWSAGSVVPRWFASWREAYDEADRAARAELTYRPSSRNPFLINGGLR